MYIYIHIHIHIHIYIYTYIHIYIYRRPNQTNNHIDSLKPLWPDEVRRGWRGLHSFEKPALRKILHIQKTQENPW